MIAGQEPDFVIAVAEYDGETLTAAAEFHSARAFRQSAAQPPRLPSGIALDDPDFEIRATALDHGVTSLAFALREKLRVNVWKDRLVRMGLAVGPWLKAAKAAIREGKPDATPIVAVRAGKQQDAVALRLGEVREAFRVGPGESLAYVVDAAYHASNAARIVDLVRGVDTLFIETVFLEEDREIAAQRRHLTAAQAGSLARRARARRLVPFHLSPRYSEREDRVRQEAYDAFAGTIDAAKPA